MRLLVEGEFRLAVRSCGSTRRSQTTRRLRKTTARHSILEKSSLVKARVQWSSIKKASLTTTARSMAKLWAGRSWSSQPRQTDDLNDCLRSCTARYHAMEVSAVADLGRASCANAFRPVRGTSAHTWARYWSGNRARWSDVQGVESQGGDRRIFPALQRVETYRLDFQSGSVALSASLQVFHRPRASAQRAVRLCRVKLTALRSKRNSNRAVNALTKQPSAQSRFVSSSQRAVSHQGSRHPVHRAVDAASSEIRDALLGACRRLQMSCSDEGK